MSDENTMTDDEATGTSSDDGEEETGTQIDSIDDTDETDPASSSDEASDTAADEAEASSSSTEASVDDDDSASAGLAALTRGGVTALVLAGMALLF